MPLRHPSTPLLVVLALAGVGCGCGDRAAHDPPARRDDASVRTEAGSNEDPPGTGRVAGRIGAAASAVDPPRGQDPAPGCPSTSSEGSVRVTDGGLADAIVWLRPAPAVAGSATRVPAPLEPADRPASLRECALAPRALVGRVGDTLVLDNDDDRFHAVQLRLLDGGQERPTQTIALAPMEQDVRFTLEQPGLYRLRSPQLPFLRGLLLVLRQDEYAATSHADGSFALGALPAASYDVQVLHERLAPDQTTVDVDAGETAAVTATLAPAPVRSP